MILILGGTTEGRVAVRVADEAAATYYYSTKGTLQSIECAHGIRLTGAMNAEEMECFCRDHAIKLLIDAAHPFAQVLHQTIEKVSKCLQIPVIRYERRYPPRDEDLIWCDSYADAIHQMENKGIQRLLALSGVNTLAPLRPYWRSHTTWFRILEREESLSLAEKQGFPQERLVFYREGEDELKLLEQLHPDAILTKESGFSGYFTDKVNAARQFGIPVFVVKRPALPETFYRVYGEDGLRKQIERLLPEFFPLKSGYTTGACATAAAKAALLALLSRKEQTESQITLPSGEQITLPVAYTEWAGCSSATCTVIKESGDDPDVTNHSRIRVTVQLSPDSFCRVCQWNAQRACPRGEACAAAFCIADVQNPFRSAFPQIYIPPEFPRCTLPQAAALRSVPCLKREHSRIASLRDVPFFRFYAFFCSSDILQRITSFIIAKVRNCRFRNGYTGYYFVFMLYAFLYT